MPAEWLQVKPAFDESREFEPGSRVELADDGDPMV